MVDYRGGKRRGGVISGVNITPFTDVVLVLLIVFMVSAPGLLTSSLKIQLPGSSTAGESRGSQFTLGLDRSGTLYLEGKAVDEKQLRARLSTLGEEDVTITLNADSRAAHGLVVEVMDLLRRAGVKKILVGAVKK